MAEFINTVDTVGDDALVDSIITKTMTEYCDDVIEEITAYAFYGCTNLKKVYCPNVTKCGYTPWYGSSIEEIDLPKLTNPIGGVSSSATGYHIFKGNASLKKLNVPSITDNLVLDGCSSLEELKLNVYSISRQYAFRDCTSLKKLDLQNCKTIGTSSTNYSIFRGCSALEILILRSNSVCQLLLTGFSNTPYIYVPASLVDSYKADSAWSTYADRIRAIEDYPEICNS